MKARFQIVRDSLVIFERLFDVVTTASIAGHSAQALEEFGRSYPGQLLFSSDVTMQWVDEDSLLEKFAPR